PAYEKPDQEGAKTHHGQRHGKGTAHHAAELFRLAQISSDEQDHSVRKAYDLRDSRMTPLAAARPPLAETPVEKRGFGPACRVEHTRLNALDVSGENEAARIRDQV